MPKVPFGRLVQYQPIILGVAAQYFNSVRIVFVDFSRIFLCERHLCPLLVTGAWYLFVLDGRNYSLARQLKKRCWCWSGWPKAMILRFVVDDLSDAGVKQLPSLADSFEIALHNNRFPSLVGLNGSSVVGVL